MSSQYWLIPLTVEFEHGPPGGLAAAAGIAIMSSATAPVDKQSNTFLTLGNTASRAW
jgi:hypothetical protein